MWELQSGLVSEPIRVLHFADLHIGMENFGQIDPITGLNSRVLDFIARLKEIASAAETRGADLVVFAGDAFKTRDPNPTYQREFARQVKRMADAGITVVLLVGNHDVPVVDKRASSVDIFRTLGVGNVLVGSGAGLHRVETRRGPVQIITVPWPQRTQLIEVDELRGQTSDALDAELVQAVHERINTLATEADPNTPTLLTGHFTVAGSVFGSERNVMVGRDVTIALAALTQAPIDYVALGHIHKHQSLNGASYPPVVYSGSLERIDFGEERQDKGFCWVELSRNATRWTFEPLAVRPFVTIDADATGTDGDPTDVVLRAIDRHDIVDAIVRVRVKLTAEQDLRFRSRDVEAALGAARHVAAVTRDIVRETRSRLGVRNPESLTPMQLLEGYLTSRDLNADERAAVLALAEGILPANPQTHA